jgi:cytochrome c peroxidase
VPTAPGLSEDTGRAAGVDIVLNSEFNCQGPFSDAGPDDCPQLRFIIRSGAELVGAFKTPTLRNVAEMPPYMHAGQFATLDDVLHHYNRAAPGPFGHTDLQRLRLSRAELARLESFLRTLSGPLAVPPELLAPPES